MPTIDLTTQRVDGAQPPGQAIPAGPWRLGDRIIYTDDVSFPGQPSVGKQHGFVTVVRRLGAGGATFQNETTFVLPEGQITAQGIFDAALIAQFTLAITGGTNKYEKIQGVIEGTVRHNTNPISGQFRIKY